MSFVNLPTALLLLVESWAARGSAYREGEIEHWAEWSCKISHFPKQKQGTRYLQKEKVGRPHTRFRCLVSDGEILAAWKTHKLVCFLKRWTRLAPSWTETFPPSTAFSSLKAVTCSIQDPHDPSHALCVPLPSGRRYRNGKLHNISFRDNYFPTIIKFLKQPIQPCLGKGPT